MTGGDTVSRLRIHKPIRFGCSDGKGKGGKAREGQRRGFGARFFMG